MMPENQCVTIAELCGWKHIEGLTGRPPGKGFERVPDYTRDLNAMHDAEKTLLFSKRKKYRCILQAVMSKEIIGTVAIDECVHATAAQKSEAFLRATGRWVES